MASENFTTPLLNEALTAEQATLIRKNLSSRRSELNFILKVVGEEEKQSQMLASAIGKLQTANKDAKSALVDQQELLNQLLEFEKSMGTLNSTTQAPQAYARVTTSTDEIVRLVGGQIADASKDLSRHISGIKQRMSQLQLYIQKMEMELYNKRLVYADSVRHVINAKSYQIMIENSISSLISGLGCVSSMPSELLVDIFRICVDKEIETYWKNPKSYMAPVTALKMSHVCRLWRQIILGEKDLWRLMAIYSRWSSHRLSMFNHVYAHGPAHPVLLLALSSYSTAVRKGKGKIGDVAIPLIEKYDLNIFADVNILPTLLTCQFTQPTSVALYLSASVSHQSFEGLLAPFIDVKKLTILSKTHYEPLSPRLIETQPQLTHLTLNLEGSTSIDLAGYLVPNLVELHIIQGQASIMPAPTPVGLSLPKLKVLGVTPPNTDFAHSLKLPLLRKVVLYGITNPEHSEVITLVHFASAIGLDRIEELELHTWSYLFNRWWDPKPRSITCITEIADKMRSIVKLKCINSIIDGSSLVCLVKKLTSMEASSTAALETVIIDCCSGVTREDCDAIRRLVKKMKVYA